MNPTFQAHPRDAVMDTAGVELVNHLADWRARHGLTTAEYAHILLTLAGRGTGIAVVLERETAPKVPDAAKPND